MSAQHKVTANAPKAAAMIVAMMISIGIDVLSRPRGSRLGPAPIIFDDPPTLAQRNPFIGPSLTRSQIGRPRDNEVLHACEVLKDVLAITSPGADPINKVAARGGLLS